MHFAASLEILKKESLSADKSYYSIWGGKTTYLERRAIGFKTLMGFKLVRPFELVELSNPETISSSCFEFDEKWVSEKLEEFEPQISKIKNLDDLQRIKIGQLNPSAALANEVVSLTKFRNADLSKVIDQIQLLLKSYLEVYNATSIFIQKNKIQKVHLYNGRFIHERAVWDCVKANKLEICLFEVMRDRFLQRPEGFHDRITNQKIMRFHWEASKSTALEKIEIGSKYFAELRGNSNPFLKTKTSSLKIDKPYFVYFTNSDDEAIGFWEVWQEGLGSQIQCVEKLQDYFDSQDKLLLVIRMHPNLLNKSKSAISAWEQIIPKANSLVIGPGEGISSYELLDNAQGSISFGSTLSLESAFAEVPSLVLADCGYDELGAVDKVTTWLEVYSWINSTKNIPKSEINRKKINSCIRGYYLATFGFNFKHTELVHREWGSWDAINFLNKKINRGTILNYIVLIMLRLGQFRFMKLMERV